MNVSSPTRGTGSIRALALVFLLMLGPGGTAVMAEIVHSCTNWPGARWQPDPATYGITIETGVPIVMDDGVTLYADVGYPADLATGQRARGTFPVLLAQNPYIFTGPPDIFYVSRGYIYVNADVRGTLRTTAPNNGPLTADNFGERQAQDGVELVHWAATKLSGSNGKLGLIGCSFLGIDQIFTAAALSANSPVKAMVPACAANSYANVYFAGGIPSQTIPLFGLAAANAIDGTLHLTENVAQGEAFVANVLAGGDQAYDRAYWRQRTTSRVAANIVRNGIPALLWTGWNATESHESIKLFSIFQNQWLHRPDFAPMTPDQPTTGRYQLVVGPGAHGQGLDPSIELEWYDTWLKDQDTGIDRTRTSMHLDELQTNRWVNTASYPIVSRYSPYYLGANGELSTQRSAAPGDDNVVWDQPGASGTTLSYTTKPFSRGATLAGPIAASIYADTNNSNMELVATLNDIAPNGTVSEISFGALIGSMRKLSEPSFDWGGRHRDGPVSWYDEYGTLTQPAHPFAADEYLVPGKTERFDVELYAMLWSVLPGHSLQFVLSTQASAAVCTSELSALSKARPCVLTAPQQASLPGGVYGIHRNRLHASSINLPLLPFEELRETASAVTPTSPLQTQPLDWGGNPVSCRTR